MRAVGVELDEIAQLLDGADQLRKLRFQGGFAAGDTDAVQHPPPFFQEGEDVILRNHRFFIRTENQTSVLAEGTAEIAAAKKDCRGSIAGIIQQS